MLSITSFPRRFPTANKRKLRLQAAQAASASLSPAARAELHSLRATAPANSPLRLAAAVNAAVVSSPIPSSSSSSSSVAHARFLQSAARSASASASSASSSSSAAAAMAHDDDDDLDAYLFGERSDDWFTTSRDPRDPSAGFPGVDPVSRRLHSVPMPNLRSCSREEMLDYFDNSWALTDALFASLQGERAFSTPPPHHLRHPLIFYYGHPTCFFVNKFVVSGLLDAPVNPHFEHIFEVGVDEMRWDDMSKNEMDWPRVADVTDYRRQVYQLIRSVIETHPGLEPGHAQIDEHSPLWALQMALEHERIHLETSSMLMLEHPVHFFSKSSLLPDYHPSAYRHQLTENGGSASGRSSKTPVSGVDYPVNEMLPVAGGRVHIGKPRDFPTFGWDNEYGERDIDVPACKASKFLVSNGEFREFVAAGGYLEPRYWTELGWEWRCFRNTKWPTFWVPDGPSGSHLYKLRALFEEIPMQWDWPAQVNLHEAQAFCKWKTEAAKASGTASDVVYHLTTEPIHQLLRDPADRSSDTTGDAVMAGSSTGELTGKNFNFSHLSFSPVDALPPTQSGFHDVFGNAWEWCEDMFSALPGFYVHRYYDDFSAPCFDGEHHVIMGGSFVSSGDNGASKFARYHFRPHFFQHAGFRVVEQSVDQETQSISLATTCVNAPGPYTSTTVVGSPYRQTDRVRITASGKAVETSGSSGTPTTDALFDDVRRKTELALEEFVASTISSKALAAAAISGAPIKVVREGAEDVRALASNVSLVVSLPTDEATASALRDLGFQEISESARQVPVFERESATSATLSVETATAWQRGN